MGITNNEMLMLMHNPDIIQKKIINYIEAANNNKLEIVDATNPFNLLLEATAVLSSNAIIESTNIVRSKYPNLALGEEDIYQHVTDYELTNMFALPAEAIMTFYVSIVDIKQKGHRVKGGNFVEIVIPTGTFITVVETNFTLLNDISVKYYDNGSSYVSLELNKENDLAYDNISAIDSEIVNSSDGTPLISFSVKVKQVKKYSYTKPVIASDGFNQIVNIDPNNKGDKYCFAHVSYKNETTNGKYVSIPKSHTESYIDPNKPTVYISLGDNKNVLFKIPPVYIVDGNISGNINIDVYTTRGKTEVPLAMLPTEDYKLTLGDITKSPQAAKSKEVAIICSSNINVTGGHNGLSLEEIRDSVINNTLGNVNIPITELQLDRLGKLNGYTIMKATDVITSRLYIAMKSLPYYTNSDTVFCSQDVFFNTCRIVLNEVKDNNNIIVQDAVTIIKSNSVFKNMNSIVSVLSNDELRTLTRLEGNDLIDHLKENKYFYNPYYYIVENDASFSTTRVYDLDRPKVVESRILDKNGTVKPESNIEKYSLDKMPYGYRLIVKLTTNPEFNAIPKDTIVLQLKLPLLFGTGQYAYFNSTYVQDQDWYVFEIHSDMLINSDDMLDLKNGESSTPTKKFKLDTNVTLYTMTSSTTVLDPSSYLSNEVYNPLNIKYVVFTKESMSLSFGTKLKYIYNKLYNAYTPRRWRTHPVDVPLLYTEDVYRIDPVTGSGVTCTPGTDGNHTLTYDIIHRKGDPVLDSNNQPIFKFRKGDNVLDDNGNPIVDVISGVERYIDILLLEYEFFVANSIPYKNYKNIVLDTLKTYITLDMEKLNGSLIENTTLLYKSFKTSRNVNILVNNVIESIPYMITPDVTLYLSGTKELDASRLESYKNTIGAIINKHCDMKTIVMENIKADIKKAIGSTVSGVKISGLATNDPEIITVRDDNIKLVMNKRVATNSNHEYVVKYNLRLTIQYI